MKERYIGVLYIFINANNKATITPNAENYPDQVNVGFRYIWKAQWMSDWWLNSFELTNLTPSYLSTYHSLTEVLQFILGWLHGSWTKALTFKYICFLPVKLIKLELIIRYLSGQQSLQPSAHRTKLKRKKINRSIIKVPIGI